MLLAGENVRRMRWPRREASVLSSPLMSRTEKYGAAIGAKSQVTAVEGGGSLFCGSLFNGAASFGTVEDLKLSAR